MVHKNFIYKAYQHKWLFLLLGTLAFLVACSQMNNSTASRAQPVINLQDCKLSSPGSTLRLDARCGQLEVFENREAKSGRTIALNIAVIPAISRNPIPDPLFFIPGGPGEAATESYLIVYAAFNRLNQKRDIVLVDQRGTGGSHALECSMEDEQNGAVEDSTEEVVSACVNSLDADLRFYTTQIAMQDLDQVREALGYPQINLYGASYGTRAALEYLRQFPQNVRTVILDGVAPPNWLLGPSTSADGQRAIQAIFERCQKEPACSQAFPNLADEFEALLTQIDRLPVEVQLDHPLTGEPTTYTLDRDTFTNVIHLLSYTPETAVLLPLLIHSTYAEQDFRRFAAQALSTFTNLEQSISNGMRFSVVCAEDVPFYPANSDAQGYLGDFVFTAFQDICAYWPVEPVSPDFHKAVQSDSPVLLLSGEADPVTPPSNAELAAETLSNSQHWIVPGMGHINIYRGCIPNLATDFIEKGDFEGIDAACVQNIAPMPIFVNFNGPLP